MAIKIRKSNFYIYASSSGLVNEREKKKAEKIHNDLKVRLSFLYNKLQKQGLIKKNGLKTDPLKVWYQYGKVINSLGTKYKIIGSSDEKFFWKSIYDYIPASLLPTKKPKKIDVWKKNHFRKCAFIAKRPYSEVVKVGTWVNWLDLIDNKRIFDDPRVYDWTVSKIQVYRRKKWDHKKIRTFLYKISAAIKDVETTILSNEELVHKLNSIKRA